MSKNDDTLPGTEEDTDAKAGPSAKSRFDRISMKDILAAQPEDVSAFDEELFAMLSSRIASDLEEKAEMPPHTDEAIQAVIRAQNDRISKLSALVWLLDRQMNANRVPLYRLLDIDPLHYAEDMASEHAPDAVFRLTPLDKVVGANWHARNSHGGRSWIWSGPESVSTIVLPNLGGGRLELNIILTIAEWLDMQEDLDVRLGGRDLVLSPGEQPKTWTAQIDLAPTPEQEFMTLCFCVRRMSSAHEEGRSSDRRKIGVAFHGLELTKAR